MKKRMILLILGGMLATALFSINALAASEIAVKINDEPVVFEQPPIIRDNRILVPIRALAETMKFDVDWDGSSQTVTIEDMSKILELRIGDDVVNKTHKYGYDNRYEDIKIDVPAAIYEDYTYVPLRVVTELFGAEVTWKQETQTAEIKYLNTYGKIITFEDEGIEKLCRLDVMIGYNHEDKSVSSADLKGLVMAELFRNEPVAEKEWKEKLYKNSSEEWWETWGETYNEYFDSVYDEGNIPIYDGPFYEGMALQITQLGFNDFMCPSWIGIHSLNDIKYLPNVKNIELSGCKSLNDISGLKCNKTYEEIWLDSCPIYDFDVLNDIVVEKHIQFNSGCEAGRLYYISDSDFCNPKSQDYQTFARQVTELYHKINSVYSEIISDKMSDYEKAKAIHDWILDNTEYDHDSAYTENVAPHAHDFIGVFLDGKAVCQGYAETFEFLCNMAGLDCMTIPGDAGGPHGWNIVKIDGNYYHVDTTFDDTGSMTDKYFLKSDEFMKQNHSWETNIIGLHECPKSYGE